MKTLILGGIKSGKSSLAESLATNTDKTIALLATATADDDEMRARIERHKQSRPSHWEIIEEPVSLAAVLAEKMADDKCIIIDCLTLWITNLLLAEDKTLLDKEIKALIDLTPKTTGSLIMVSNETSMGIIPMGELTRRYCDKAGLLHQQIAEKCDNVVLTIAGLPMALKGSIENV